MFQTSAMMIAGMAVGEIVGRAMEARYSYGDAAVYALIATAFLVVAAARGELSKQ